MKTSEVNFELQVCKLYVQSVSQLSQTKAIQSILHKDYKLI